MVADAALVVDPDALVGDELAVVGAPTAVLGTTAVSVEAAASAAITSLGASSPAADGGTGGTKSLSTLANT